MDEEKDSVVAMFTRVLGVHRDVAVALVNDGHTTIEEVAYVPLDELVAMPNLEGEQILFARRKAREYLSRNVLDGD